MRAPLTVTRLALAALMLLASAVQAASTHSGPSCRARLEQAYTRGTMPDNFAALCGAGDAAGQGHDRDWLSELELGAEVDIVRYWDLLRLADDLDGGASPLPLAKALLPDILAQTRLDATPPPSWWDRFQAWLNKRLDQQDDVDWAWLEKWVRMLERHGEALAVAFRIMVVLTLVGVLYLILREVEIHGGLAWPWRRKARRAPLVSAVHAGTAPPLDFAAVLALPASARTSALLRWLQLELYASKRLPDDDSLTNREQLALLAGHSPPLAAPYARVLDAVEPCIYGGHAPVALDELAAQVSALRDAAAS